MMRKKTHLDTEAMTILPFEVEELSKQFPVAWYKSRWQVLENIVCSADDLGAPSRKSTQMVEMS